MLFTCEWFYLICVDVSCGYLVLGCWCIVFLGNFVVAFGFDCVWWTWLRWGVILFGFWTGCLWISADLVVLFGFWVFGWITC